MSGRALVAEKASARRSWRDNTIHKSVPLPGPKQNRGRGGVDGRFDYGEVNNK